MENMTRTFFLSVGFLLSLLTATFAATPPLSNNMAALDASNCVACDGLFPIPDISCDANIIFVNFTTNGPAGTPFTVLLNGITHEFVHGQPSYLLTTTSNQPFVELVFFGTAEDCLEVASFDNPCAESPCSINDLAVTATCQNNGLYQLTVDFVPVNPANASFDLMINGAMYGFYPYTALPLTLENVALATDATFNLTVCENDNANCCATVVQTLPDCEPNCDNIFSAPEITCDGTTTTVTFSTGGAPGTGFTAYLGGDFYMLEHGQPSYTLTFDGNEPFLELIFDDIITGCALVASFDNDCYTPALCSINDLAVTATCQNNGLYQMTVDFVPVNPSNASFDLWINGAMYGFYPYTALPLTLENVALATDATFNLTVCENDNANCCATVVQTLPDCEPNCDDIFNAPIITCDGTTTYLNFTTGGTTGTGFVVTADGQSFVFEHGQPNYTISVDVNTPTFTVIFDDGITGCVLELLFQAPCPQNPACVLEQVTVVPTACNPNHVYGFTVDFNTNRPDLPYRVRVGTQTYGPFAYSEFPVTVGSIVGNTTTTTPVRVWTESEVCDYNTEITHACPMPCEIYAFQAYQTCEGGMRTVRLSIGSNLPELSQVQVLMNDVLLGTFAAGSFPRWFDLPFDIDQHVVFNLIAANADCQAETDLTVVACEDLCDNFAITDLFAQPDPNIPGWLSVSFTVSGGGGGIPIIMTNPAFPNDGSQTTWWNDPQSTALFVPVFPGVGATDLVFSTPFNNCSTAVVVAHEPISCGGLESIVYEGMCTNANGYVVDIDIPNAQPHVLYAVMRNNDILEEFLGSAFPVTLSVTPNSTNVWTLTVRILGTQCDQELVFQPANCNPGCPEGTINDVAIYSEGCNNQGTYAITVNFNSNTHDVFDVWNQTTGQRDTIITPQLPYTFPPVPAGTTQSQIRIAPLGLSGPCVVEETFVLVCEPQGTCGFTNIVAEPYACDGDQFMVDIAFANANGGAAGFYIFADGMIFGPFPYGQNFYTFGPLNGTQTAHNIMLLDIANPACFGNYALTYNCSEACSINEVLAMPFCDGETFSVRFDISASNTGATFLIVGNGVNYGTFSYDDLPITLTGFEGDGQSTYAFGIIDLHNPNCAAWTSVQAPNCQPCNIGDLAYEVECGQERLTLTIDFDYENTTSNRFDLYLNGDLYERFLYTDLPLTLTNINYDVAGGEIQIVDAENENCGTSATLEVPCCTLGNAINALSINDCEADGTYSLRIGEFFHRNTSDSLIIDYTPAGTNIIESVTVAYTDLPTQVGPLAGNGQTSYIIVLRDSEGGCAVTTTIEATYCDNSDCVEFEGTTGVFAPAFGYDSGDAVATENGVTLTYQRHPETECACNLFVTDGIPGTNFGSGHIVATQNSGFGLLFTNAVPPFNTVNIDYYYTGGGITIAVNNAAPVSAVALADLPTAIVQVTPNPAVPGTGVLTFSGDNIERIRIYTLENGAFDNVCMSQDDNVWPGDTNADNIAQHFDLLTIGIAYGATGPSRANATTEWIGLPSANWGDFTADGLNQKHADANGDGIVNDADRLVLEQNYGLTHGEVLPYSPLPHTELDPALQIGTAPISAGSNFEIPVIAGTIEQAINDIYGLAFTLQLDPEVFDMGNLEIGYPVSWFGEPGINVSTIHRIYPDGRLEVALTRTDRNNVSGYGPILHLRGIIDDIAGTTPHVPTDLFVQKIKAVDSQGLSMPLRPEKADLLITRTQMPVDRTELAASFAVFPNPTTGALHFTNAYQLPPDRIRLFNAAGQLLVEQKNPGMEIDVQHLPAGIYMLQIHIEGQIFTQRVARQ